MDTLSGGDEPARIAAGRELAPEYGIFKLAGVKISAEFADRGGRIGSGAVVL